MRYLILLVFLFGCFDDPPPPKTKFEVAKEDANRRNFISNRPTTSQDFPWSISCWSKFFDVPKRTFRAVHWQPESSGTLILTPKGKVFLHSGVECVIEESPEVENE